MNKTLLLSILLLTGCADLSNYMLNQECNFDKEVCQQYLTDFNDDRTKFQTDGAYLAVYDVNEQKYLEKLDSGIQNNRYSQKNVVNLLKSDTVMSPDEMLQHYVTLIENKNNQIKPKDYANILQTLSNNVQKGKARNANSKKCSVYGLTATDNINENTVVATFLGHFIKDDRTYAIIVTFDNPQALKSTYGYKSSGWNATKLAGKIINSMCEGK